MPRTRNPQQSNYEIGRNLDCIVFVHEKATEGSGYIL